MKRGTIKAIIFTRVSSKQQDTQRQVEDLMPLAKNDGYKDSEISIIQYKESATKNDISKRKSIAELKDLINNNDIECVYVTEIYRLARRNDVLYEVLALLGKQNICLFVQQPMPIRTIENGKQNAIANVLISFMSYLAVSESDIKLERQKSGLRQKTIEGKICTSKLKFGYNRTKDNFAEINDKQAKVVRDIFDMYVNGSTIGQIWKKYNGTGFFPTNIKRASGEGRMIKILKDKTYIGENFKFKYPQIVNVELFNKVQDRLASRVSKKEVTKEVYLCKNLIHIQGRTMTPSLAKVAYVLDDRENNKRYSVNINVLDSLAWNIACEALSMMNEEEDRKRRKNVRESLKMLEMKLSNVDSIIKDLEEEKEKLNKMFQKRRMSESDYDFKFVQVEEEIAHVYSEKSKMIDTQLQLKSFLESKDDDNVKVGISSYPLSVVLQEYQEEIDNNVNITFRYLNLVQIKDLDERQKLIKQAIKSIDVTFVSKGVYDISFVYNDITLNNNLHYVYKVEGPKITLDKYDKDILVECLTRTWENRIKRPNQK